MVAQIKNQTSKNGNSVLHMFPHLSRAVLARAWEVESFAVARSVLVVPVRAAWVVSRWKSKTKEEVKGKDTRSVEEERERISDKTNPLEVLLLRSDDVRIVGPEVSVAAGSVNPNFPFRCAPVPSDAHKTVRGATKHSPKSETRTKIESLFWKLSYL